MAGQTSLARFASLLAAFSLLSDCTTSPDASLTYDFVISIIQLAVVPPTVASYWSYPDLLGVTPLSLRERRGLSRLSAVDRLLVCLSFVCDVGGDRHS